MPPVEDDVLAALRAHWHLPGLTLTRLPGGMNSTTWTVTTGDVSDRWVAKLVTPTDRDSFVRGLTAAQVVEEAGVAAGAPAPTRRGDLSADLPQGTLALLRWVDGTPLTARDQERIGRTLGRVHRALRSDRSELGFPQWVRQDAPHLDVEDWVRPAVRSALAELRGLSRPLTVGTLHADPAPEAFLASPDDGVDGCGLIDWSSAVPGPLLYDLASAVMYVGGIARASRLVESYLGTGALDQHEVSVGLSVLLKVRQAVQADYFARRIALDDRTGLDDPRENLVGLHHAREFFAAEPFSRPRPGRGGP